MISIFNGRSRGLGQSESSGIYLQVEVALRNHLAKFKGARLGVFMSIALHSDRDGWSRPGIETIRRETGYNRQTISQAIGDLDGMDIEGHRVMLVYQSSAEKGRFFRNRYLVFPTPEECRMFGKAPNLQILPCTGFPSTVEPYTVKPCTENQYIEVEPLFKESQDKGEPVSSSELPPRKDDDVVRAAVVEFYGWATGNAVTQHDYVVYEPLREAGALAWKTAICRGVLLSRERVRSMSYFAPIVQELLADWEKAKREGLAGPSEDYLRHLVQKVERGKKR